MSEPVRINPMDNPEQANATIASILSDSVPADAQPKPNIEPPPDLLFELPGSHQKVEVRELTGADEEALARVNGTFWRWISTLLEHAVETIDGRPADADALGKLLVGDRDYLLMAVRKVTWGAEIELSGIDCDHCKDTLDMVALTDDIPIKSLADAREANFTVALRNNRTAAVRLPNGHDQAVYLERENATNAERNTLMLQRCVASITDANGMEMPVEGFPSMVRDMSLPDRTRLLREIDRRMPGARYNEVPVTCPACGEKTVLGIGPVALFPDLYLS